MSTIRSNSKKWMNIKTTKIHLKDKFNKLSKNIPIKIRHYSVSKNENFSINASIS